MLGFEYRRNLDGTSEAPVIWDEIGGNSVVITLNDAIRINTSGFIALAASNQGILGFVQGVVDKNGIPVDPDSGSLNTWTMPSDNQTVAQNKVRFIPALPHYLFANDASGDLARSNLYQFFDLSDEDQVNQGSATDTATAQLQLIALDPDGDGDASKGLFRVVESLVGQIGTKNVEA